MQSFGNTNSLPRLKNVEVMNMDTTETVTPEVAETPIVEQAVITENAEPNNETVETPTVKTFTQDEVNEMITKRLERADQTAVKKAAQEARDAYIAEQGHFDWDGKPITTESAYKQALADQETRQKYQHLPEDVQNELIESKRFREQYAESQKETEARTKREEDFNAFLVEFPEADYKTIPQSVWDDVAKGRSLVDAFTKHENMSLKEQLTAERAAKQIQQQNEQNAQSSTGSVTGQGSAPVTAFYSQKQVGEMSQSEVNRNWKAINESMKNPKFYD